MNENDENKFKIIYFFFVKQIILKITWKSPRRNVGTIKLQTSSD